MATDARKERPPCARRTARSQASSNAHLRLGRPTGANLPIPRRRPPAHPATSPTRAPRATVHLTRPFSLTLTRSGDREFDFPHFERLLPRRDAACCEAPPRPSRSSGYNWRNLGRTTCSGKQQLPPAGRQHRDQGRGRCRHRLARAGQSSYTTYVVADEGNCDDEEDMLEAASEDPTGYSRICCQIKSTPA